VTTSKGHFKLVGEVAYAPSLVPKLFARPKGIRQAWEAGEMPTCTFL